MQANNGRGLERVLENGNQQRRVGERGEYRDLVTQRVEWVGGWTEMERERAEWA